MYKPMFNLHIFFIIKENCKSLKLHKKNEYIIHFYNNVEAIKIMIFKLKKIVNSEVDTPDGKATLQEIYVTELGYIMAKLWYINKNMFINHKIGEISELLEREKFSLSTEWTKRLKIEEKLVA